MNSTLQDRRNLLTAACGGAALLWLAFGRGGHSANDFKVPELTIAQAKALVDAGVMAIDVRDQEKFAYRHLPTAVLVPLVVLRVGIPAWLEASKTKPIIVYCNRGVSHGPEATHLLQAAGFTQVANLTSGIEGWSEAGMPIKSS